AAIPAMALNPLNDVLLHSSVHKDAAGCVALLESFGVQPATAFPHGKISPLHTAARYGAVKVLELCLGAGSVPNVRDRSGRTPLYMAARYNRPEAVAVLLRYGGDATIADKDGVTPLQIAQQKNKKHAVAALMGASQPNL
ncbi:MAG: ankyrin repeat domain-containing protein, partial [Fibrella sp.]|nr:ankyrin repeat domain-containing protein [Armatimonadota bacterium]